MSAIAGNAARSISASMLRRWQDADPLLPAPAPPPPGCGTQLLVAGPDGHAAAVGTCGHKQAEPGSLDMAWGTTRRFQLTAAVAGPDVESALEELLSQWHEHLGGLPGATDEDSTAILNWPNRDIYGIAALVRQGFSPMTTLAARTMGRRGPPGNGPAWPDGGAIPDGTAGRDGGVRYRRAGPADIDTVVRLGLEVVRYDAHFGNGGERTGTVEALRLATVGLLDEPEPWTWLAERDGRAVGMVCAQRPHAAGWITPLVRPAPAAYLMLMFVQPAERGGGIGSDLVARLHRDIEAAGVAVTLLHYQTLNPLSAPFWNQRGYRPLWTSWEARPARILR